MKFSIFMIAMGKGRSSDAEIYDHILSDVALAEEVGFDGFWFAEHHFRADFSLSPSPNLLVAAASTITDRIRLGTAVNVLPLHNPIALAEQGAVLDILTKGRFEWGIGRGIAGLEFEKHGIDAAESRERFEEVHDIVTSAWETGQLSFEGRHYNVPETPLVPSIVQKPHPPVWVSAQSPASVTWTAERGYACMQVGEPTAVGRGHLTRYREAAAAAGRELDPERGPIVPLRYVYVAESDQQARRACMPKISEFWKHFSRIAAPDGSVSDAPGYEYWRDRETGLGQYADLDYDGLNDAGMIITGSPETVIEGIRRQQEELEVTHMICDFWRGVESRGDRQKSMRLFAEEVMPAFADRTAVGQVQ